MNEDQTYITFSSWWDELIITGIVPFALLVYFNSKIYFNLSASEWLLQHRHSGGTIVSNYPGPRGTTLVTSITTEPLLSGVRNGQGPKRDSGSTQQEEHEILPAGSNESGIDHDIKDCPIRRRSSSCSAPNQLEQYDSDHDQDDDMVSCKSYSIEKRADDGGKVD